MANIELELIADPDAMASAAVQYLEGMIAGFEARPGNIETVLLQANAQIGAEIVEQAAQIDPLIFSYLGEDLLGIPAREATQATATATVTWAADVDDATVYPAGSLLSVPSPTDEPIAFQTNDDLTAPAGGGVDSVEITALEPGEAGNGCFGEAEPIDIVDGVESVEVTTPSAGGTEDETTDEYTARLASALTILAPRPILPADFAVLAQQVPGVERATAVDLYQPSTGQGGYGTPRGASPATDVPRCVTVAVTTGGGGLASGALMQQVYELLDANREVNFLVYVIPPTYTTIDVQATVMAHPGYAAADVEAAVEVELSSWLSPGAWGSPPGLVGDAVGWTPDNTVRLYEAVETLNRAAGVHYVESVQIRIPPAAYAAADVGLTGPVGLPQAGAMAITVHTP